MDLLSRLLQFLVIGHSQPSRVLFINPHPTRAFPRRLSILLVYRLSPLIHPRTLSVLDANLSLMLF